MYFLCQQILTDHHCQPCPPSSYLNICRVRTPQRKFSTDRSHPGRSPFDLHWHALHHKAGAHKKILNVSLDRRCVTFIHNAGGVCTCRHAVIWFVGLLWISTVIYQCSLHYYALLQTLWGTVRLASRLQMCPVCNHYCMNFWTVIYCLFLFLYPLILVYSFSYFMLKYSFWWIPLYACFSTEYAYIMHEALTWLQSWFWFWIFKHTNERFRIALPLIVAQMAVFSSGWNGNVICSCDCWNISVYKKITFTVPSCRRLGYLKNNKAFY